MLDTPDIFLSHAPADAEWAGTWLVPKLHAQGFRVTSANELLAGGARIEQIAQTAEKAKHTLLVLSPDWVASQWETFTGLISHSTDPVGRQRRTIPLLRRMCQPPRSIARLVSADFASDDPSAWEKQFSRLLAVLSGQQSRTALGPPLGALMGAEAPTNFKFPQNPHFVGRDQELAEIHELLDDVTPLGINAARANFRAAGLTGLGGVGKTQLVVEYIHRFGKSYPGGIFWINAADGIADDFVEIGRVISGNGHDNTPEELIRISYDYLRSDPDILLVVDNLNEPSLLNQDVAGILTPISLPCRLLFTTRRRDLRGLRSIAVDMLSEPDALRLLLRSRPAVLNSNHPEHAMAIKLCATLGGLPLAIEMAAAYLEQEEDVSLSGYLTRLGNEGSLQTLDTLEQAKDWSPTWHDPIQITLQSQWDALTNTEARLLLQAAALLPEAAAIPLPRLSLLTGLSTVAVEGYPAIFASALRRLHNYSLIETLEGDQVRLHPLVHEFVRSQIANLDEFSVQCTTRMATALEDMLRVNQEILERDVDRLLADIKSGLTLDPENRPLGELRLILDKEAHTLRKFFHKEFPGYILQQVRDRAFKAHKTSLAARAESALSTLKTPWFQERFSDNVDSPALLRIFDGHTDRVTGVAITPNGTRALSASDDNTLRLWDLDSGQCVRILEGHSSVVSCMAIALDGERAISASEDKTLRLWNLDSGQCVRILEGHTGRITGIEITPNGTRALSASSDKTLRLWELDSGRCLLTFEGHTRTVRGIAIAPDGTHAISASQDNSLRLWDLDSGQCLHILELEGYTDSVTSVAITPDGTRAISTFENGTLRLWYLSASQAVLGPEVQTNTVGSIISVVITPDSARAISASQDNSLRLWDLDNGKTLLVLKGHTSFVTRVAITPDGTHAISASADKTLRLWDLDSGQCSHILEGHTAMVTSVAITPDGMRAVSASSDGTLRLWELSSGQNFLGHERHTDSVTSVAITPDGTRAVSASLDKTLRSWDVDSGKTLITFEGHLTEVSDVAITPDGTRAISAASDQTLRLWDLDSGQCLHTFKDGTRLTLANGVAITPDGTRAIFAIAYGLQLWDLNSRRYVRTFDGHASFVQCVAVTPDGTRAISGSSWDKTLRLWHLESGQCLRVFSGHTDTITSVAITSNGARVISASEDRTLRLWDLETGQCLRIFDGHIDHVTDVAITPEGMHAISASEDRTLRLWDLETGQALLAFSGEKYTSVAIDTKSFLIAAGDESGAIHFIDYIDGQQNK